MKTRLTTTIAWAMAVASSALGQTVDTAFSGTVKEPYAIAVDSSTASNFSYISDSINGRVVRYAPATGEIKDLTFREFSSPQGIVLVRGGLAVADFGAHQIKFLGLDGTVNLTVGSGTRGSANNDDPTLAEFDFPAGLASDAAGNVYVADSKNGKVRLIAPDNKVSNYGPDTDYLGLEGVAVADDGRVFVADTRNQVIRMISADRSTVTIIAGQKGVPGAENGLATGASFNYPKGLLWIGGETGLLVADTQNQAIRRVYVRAGRWYVDTFAGVTGSPGFQNGAAATATFFEPTGLAKDLSGLILAVDLKNNAVRRIVRPPVTTPTFNALSGIYSNALALSITNDKDVVPVNSVYRYTTDGTDPVTSSPVFPRVGSVTLAPPAGSTNVILKVLGTSPDAMAGTIVSNNFGFYVAPIAININGGTFTNNVGVTNTTLTAGVTIRYEINGSDPTESSPVWTDGSWGTTGTLAVRGFRSGFAPSAVTKVVFTFVVATPVVAPDSGTFDNVTSFTAATGTADAVIRYTTNGSEPTEVSDVYSGPVAVNSNQAVPGSRVIRVKAFKAGYLNSDEVSRTYTLTAGTPSIDVAGGSFTNNVAVNISTTTAGAALHYTTDGTVPTDASPLWVNGSYGTDGVLQVRATLNGFNPSTVISNRFNFTVTTPVLDVNSGTYSNDVAVTVTGGTSGALYHYTLDGSDPTVASPSVASGGSITVNANARGTDSVLRIVGIKGGYASSSVVQATYVLTTDPAVISLNGGSFLNNTNVTVTTRTIGATIRYTTDGSAPTAASPVWTDGSYGVDGTLKVAVFKAGYNTSGAASAVFSFNVDVPTIDVASGTYGEAFAVKVTSQTAGSQFYYTLDGTAPTLASPSVASGSPIAISQNAVVANNNTVLTVLPYKASYAAASTLTRTYVLKVGSPVVNPAGGNYNNDVSVAVTVPPTSGTTSYFTTNGVAPTASDPAWVDGSFGTTSTLSVRATRPGFVDSDVVAVPFTFTVTTPMITPGSSLAITNIDVTATTTTTGATLRYTTDGSAPVVGSPEVGAGLKIQTNATLKVAGFKDGYLVSGVASADYQVQVDTPVLTPSQGYYPDGATVTLSVGQPGATIRYSVNGQDPTASDTAYTVPFRLSELALAQLRVRAFAPNMVPSAVANFTLVPGDTNTIGIARDLNAGAGSSVVVPVVVNLKTNQSLRSLQYRVEVWPTGGAPSLNSDLRVQAFGTNDFVAVTTGAEQNGPAATLSYGNYDTSAGGVSAKGLIITALGTNANFNVKNFATVALVVVPLPATAPQDGKYTIKVVQPSGTSDGLQDVVTLGILADKTITITQKHYIVGDTSPGRWYDAGDFGNGDLDNADVNNAFYASLGVRVPYAYTDAFDAMDAYPDDTPASVGGDGQIRFLDWQRILYRSLRRDLNNWERYWADGGVRKAVNATLGLGSPDSPTRPFASGLRASVIQPSAKIYGTAISQATAGSTVKMPIRMKMAPGRTASGLQFRAIVEPVEGGAAVTAPVNFIAASGMPSPLQLAGLPANQTTAAWSELVNPLASPIQGDALLGHVMFTLPAEAAMGTRYQVRLANADGAPNLDTQYDIESVAGMVAVGAQASLPEKNLPGVRLTWFGAAGQNYAVESAADITARDWTLESNGIVGQGRQQEYVDQATSTQTKFYRVRLVQ